MTDNRAMDEYTVCQKHLNCITQCQSMLTYLHHKNFKRAWCQKHQTITCNDKAVIVCCAEKINNASCTCINCSLYMLIPGIPWNLPIQRLKHTYMNSPPTKIAVSQYLPLKTTQSLIKTA